MSSIKIFGGKQLKGELEIQGSKNAALPIIAATILNKGITKLKNCPKILDVFHMINILEELGCKTSWEGNTVYVDSTEINRTTVPEVSVRMMRSSILYLGALLGRCREVSIAYPGGCSIGKRPIDYHLDALMKMNVNQKSSEDDGGTIHCKSERIIGNDIFLEFPSVGATQNIILTAVLSEGVTRIFNGAREPEVKALCNYLVKAGAKIRGEGTSLIEIEGVKELNDVEFELLPDRIVAGTYMVAAAATMGDVTLINTPNKQLDTIIQLLKRTGCVIKEGEACLKVSCDTRPSPINILKTQPYPGFPTDMQSQMMTLLCIAKGKSTIVESIFESRYQNIDELRKMGANLEVEGKKASIEGVGKLNSARVKAHDLRGGAALVIAGLIAEGETVVENARFIQRGYEDICRDFSLLGADTTIFTEI